MLTNFQKYNRRAPKVQPLDYMDIDEWKKYNRSPSPPKKTLRLKLKIPDKLDNNSSMASPLNTTCGDQRTLNFNQFTPIKP